MLNQSGAFKLAYHGHPLIHAGKWLLSDLLSTLTFVGLYATTHNVFIAAGARSRWVSASPPIWHCAAKPST